MNQLDQLQSHTTLVADTGDLAAILKRLRTDKDLYFNNGDEMLKAAQEALDSANAAVPRALSRSRRRDSESTIS